MHLYRIFKLKYNCPWSVRLNMLVSDKSRFTMRNSYQVKSRKVQYNEADEGTGTYIANNVAVTLINRQVYVATLRFNHISYIILN